MPINDDLITGFFQGDDLSVTRPVTNVPVGDSLTQSWMTVKADPVRDSDSEAVFQKIISAVNNPGVGQITDTGAGDTVGAVRFDWTKTDTAKLDPRKTYNFDIQHKTAAGYYYTSHSGVIRSWQQVTRST